LLEPSQIVGRDVVEQHLLGREPHCLCHPHDFGKVRSVGDDALSVEVPGDPVASVWLELLVGPLVAVLDVYISIESNLIRRLRHRDVLLAP
jgi:hypothetical protein